MSEIRYPQYRLFAFWMLHHPSLHNLETRSGKSGNQCHVSTMGKNVLYIFPSFSLMLQVLLKLRKEGITMILVAITSMVFSSSGHVYPQFTFITTSETLTSGNIRKSSSFSSKPDSITGGLVGFQKLMTSKDISDKAAKLISDSRRESSISSYESAWRQWAGWCGKWKVDPIQCPLKSVLYYLSDLFENGLAYRTINVNKSAISAYHKLLHGLTTGQSSLACSLLSGVFNHRLPQPKYTFIWDI